MIGRCLERLAFADEVVVMVDDRTTDDTAAVARTTGATVIEAPFTTFADQRNRAIAACTGDWILFVDADERVSSLLAAEVRAAVDGGGSGHRVRIENWFYGSRIRDSGYREQPIRLIRREFAAFSGDIHERLSLPGGEAAPVLEHPLVHLSHRSVLDNLGKTATYADVQAREMLASGHRKVTSLSLLRTGAVTLVRHLVIGRGFRDGAPGVVESLYQAFSIVCVHIRLWELQRSPTIPERYEALERSIS